MKRLVLLALVGAILLGATPVGADGDIYVIAGGGGVGTKITSLPYTITAPGFYYLAGNLNATTGNGITVNSDDVTIDLLGFCLSGNSNGIGINMSERKNVEVRNGTLRRWSYAISDPNGKNHRVINVRAEDNAYGIWLYGSRHLVKGCIVSDNTECGIDVNENNTVSGNQVHNCKSGIRNHFGTTNNNTIHNNANVGIFGSGTIKGNTVSDCGTGIYCTATSSVIANTATNCNTGIYCDAASTVVGNAVLTNTGQTAIYLSTSTDNYILVDQNTVSGPGRHSWGGSTSTVWGKNAGLP